MEKLNLDPDYLNTLFKFDEVKNAIDVIGNDMSVNTQQLYTWYRGWQCAEEGIVHDNMINSGGFSGFQPSVVFKRGLKIKVPAVPLFYVHGIINTENPGETPFIVCNGTRIVQSKYAKPCSYIFISHSSKDKVFVRELAKKLDFVCEYFMDEKDIAPGDRITEKINAGLESATALLLILSKNSSSSRWVANEWGGYMHSNKKIIMINTDNTDKPMLLKDIYCISGDMDLDIIKNEIMRGLV